ncbi:MAG TPA: dihydropteroate synthase [Nitrospirae bacterium]|nr:dihydropteroate synthase [bacterium BMS3Abin10]GBE38455.1 dihydropteroate synthase [bacterium BMS3Bbin08]HDH51462.1 dihydropteroate synthase [Nitrospirota bacterium]HDK41398.1 dihydropteroate synthase [Nitrospirota bacterium]HDK81962.1 dihydropteroate synthase [Nitrospirota bacterium]
MKLVWKNFDLDLSSRTYIMGILNATPDSFSDDGIYSDRKRAVARALEMRDEGADIIDIGGESTRPGAKKVSVKEEIRRVVPVIEELAEKIKIPISVDTYKSAVARAAISAGASMINDISGLRFDPKMPKVAADSGVPVVIMHIKGTPGNMQADTAYRSLIPEIMDYLREGINIARRAGVSEDRIIIDPGIGFGKNVGHNLEILKRLNGFTGFEKPILIGPSRKSFIGKTLGDLPVSERLEGTAAAAAIGIFNGANIIRVHDVRAMVRAAGIADAIKRGH